MLLDMNVLLLCFETKNKTLLTFWLEFDGNKTFPFSAASTSAEEMKFTWKQDSAVLSLPSCSEDQETGIEQD